MFIKCILKTVHRAGSSLGCVDMLHFSCDLLDVGRIELEEMRLFLTKRCVFEWESAKRSSK